MPAWTAEEIAAVRAAVASGAKSVSFSSGGTTRSMEFQSLEDLQALLAEMEGTAAAAAGTARRSVARVSKGFRGGPRGSFRRNE